MSVNFFFSYIDLVLLLELQKIDLAFGISKEKTLSVLVGK
jgi:hypothetical protein